MVKKILAVFLLGIISLAAAEILLRLQEPFFHSVAQRDFSQEIRDVFAVYQPHAYWDHSLKPGLHRVLEDLDTGRDCLVETNAQGFRSDHDIQIPKPSGLFRVFVLGDSFTEGLFCGPSVSAWIENKLKRHYPGITFEVINAGVSSHSVIPYLIRLRRQIFSFSPDLVIVNIDSTDVNDDLRILPALKSDANGMPWELTKKNVRYLVFQNRLMGSQRLLEASRHSLLIKLIWNYWFQSALAGLDREQNQIARRESDQENKILENYAWTKKETLSAEEEKLFLEWLPFPEKLIMLGREMKVPVILTVYPHPDQFAPGGSRRVPDALKNISERLENPYFDALDSLAKIRPRESLYLKDDIHFNIYGTQKWGEALGEFTAAEIEPLIRAQLKR